MEVLIESYESASQKKLKRYSEKTIEENLKKIMERVSISSGPSVICVDVIILDCVTERVDFNEFF